MPDYMKVLAHHIATERVRIGKSQRGLAVSAGAALDTVRLVENVEREPRILTTVKILRALGRPAWKALRDVEEAVYGDE